MEGWQGWDDYATFYDWENARTVGRRDVAFWRALARRTDGSALELGCGTGRVLLPLARDGVAITGIDRSAPMLARARRRLVRLGRPAGVCLVRGDIRHLPFRRPAPFDLVIAPYGILQSLVREADLVATLASVARVTARGGLLGVDLVPDLSRWAEYHRHVSLRGTGLRRGTHLTLVESVHQDRRRRLTVFDQEYVERRGRRRRVHRFSLVFRSLTVPQMARRIERAGFRIEAALGDYDGGPWDPR
ncbi:MAG TPA: class I SAM-dependent methyltransferase, partial [Candidatus Limnocylindrales bacterium]|nr:class I SAM-dependent methyltransferase [Candidatus Limnocylindrales bacterium]